MNKGKYFLVLGIFIFIITSASMYVRTYDGKLHLIFCDVGQGDTLLIRTPGRHEVLIDGGPNTKVLHCLDDHLPFWDRTLDIVLLTHPHYDHFRGLIDVLERFHVLFIGHENLSHKSEAYSVFAHAVEQEHTNERILQRGSRISFSDGVSLEILGPDQKFLHQENPDGFTGTDNPPSLIIHLTYNSFDLLVTGDSDGQDLVKFVSPSLSPDIFALPHHGSEHGFTKDAAQAVHPHIAVASLGTDNSYGHPHASVLELLKEGHVPLYRTDKQGSIHFLVDTQGRVSVQTEK